MNKPRDIDPTVAATAGGAPPAVEVQRAGDLLLPRLLVSLISLVVVGLGVLAIATQHFHGSTSKLGGAEVSLNGGRAVAMGLATVCLGLLPLALWCSGKRPALAWMLACVGAAAVSFGIAYAWTPSAG